MHKTTIYLPDELRDRIKREAARTDRSEAEVIRSAIEAALPVRRRRRVGFINGGGGSWADEADRWMKGFGER